MSAPSRPSTTFGVSTRDGRDPLGYAVAAMNKLAQSELLDRLGIRKHTERAVFTVTRGGFRTATTAGRAFARAGKRGRAGTRPGAAPARGVFDLTPTEDEQMLVDVVTELATEVVRPAAADADTACATPAEVLAAGNEIGLPILGVPESLGGLSDERTAMTGTLVAEALARGDLGIAVAALANGSVATALSLWGTDEQQATYLPAFTGDRARRRLARPHRADRPVRRPRAGDHRHAHRRRLRARRREVARPARSRRRAVRGRRPARHRGQRALPGRGRRRRPRGRGRPRDGRASGLA